MEYNSKKKTTDNFHQDRDYIFDEYCEDDITIGQNGIYSNNYKNDYYDTGNKYDYLIDQDDCYDFSPNQSDSEDNDIQFYKFNDINYLFNKFRVFHVNTTYYPFKNKETEDKYKLYYFDPDNPQIVVCPACMDKFVGKIFVLNNKVILCNNCYKNEKTINYI